MVWVRDHGFPVPEVFDASGGDLVMARVDGATMLEAMTRRPWTLWTQGRALADLHDALHEIPAPPWLERRAGTGNRLLHLDLHPANVIDAPGGPVVIDWTNAAVGDPFCDVGHAWMLLTVADPPGGRLQASLARWGRSRFAGAFIARYDLAAVGRALVEFTSRDRTRLTNLSDAERRRVQELLARLSAATGPAG